MPLFTTLIECTSPLLQLSPNWRDGTSETDSSADQYSDSSFTLTQTQGATMKFSFTGTGVALVGAMRSNHGIYSVNVDGSNSLTANGSSSTSLFQQTLYQVNGLSPSQHTLTMENQDNTFFDIDYVLVTTQVGNLSENLIVNMFKDGHPSFNYTPSSAWAAPQNLSSFVGASGHATQSSSASVSLTFEVSDGVAIYGPVGPTETTSYIVQVDGGTQLQTFSAQNQFYRSQQILFFAMGLGGGTHTVTMKIGGNSAGELAIDFANVYTAPSLGGSYASVGIGANTTTPQNITTSPSLPSGATSTPTILTVSVIPHSIIAALAILAALALGGILTSAYLFWTRIQDPRETKTEPGHPPLQTSRATVEPFLLNPYSPTTDIVEESISAVQARSTVSTSWNNGSGQSRSTFTSNPSQTHAYTSTITSSGKSGLNRLSDPSTRPPQYEYSPS